MVRPFPNTACEVGLLPVAWAVHLFVEMRFMPRQHRRTIEDLNGTVVVVAFVGNLSHGKLFSTFLCWLHHDVNQIVGENATIRNRLLKGPIHFIAAGVNIVHHLRGMTDIVSRRLNAHDRIVEIRDGTWSRKNIEKLSWLDPCLSNMISFTKSAVTPEALSKYSCCWNRKAGAWSGPIEAFYFLFLVNKDHPCNPCPSLCACPQGHLP